MILVTDTECILYLSYENLEYHLNDAFNKHELIVMYFIGY